jgi:glycosyltransferase involved in cell wall biosynthesis
MPDTPRVSIVTVARNAAATLQESIDSVRRQDYPAIEHIVIDGQSSDGTVELIRRNADQLASWTSEPDGGIYEAMNKGVARATGDWVMFLNADDALYGPHAVSSVFSRADRPWTGRLVIYGDSLLLMAGGRTRLRRAKPLRTIRFKMPFTHQGVFVSAGLLRGRPFDTRYRLAADYDFFREVYRRHGPQAFLDAGVCLNYFRVGGASYRRLALKHREFVDVIRRNETGLSLAFHLAQYTARCRVPERLRQALGMQA